MHLSRRFRGGNVGPPSLEGFPTFREKLVALVNSCNPRDRAGLVIEDLVGDVGRNAEPGHARHAGPAQVVEPPPSNTGELVEDTFGSTESPEGLGSEQREDQQTIPVRARQYGQRLLGEVDDVRLGILRP